MKKLVCTTRWVFPITVIILTYFYSLWALFGYAVVVLFIECLHWLYDLVKRYESREQNYKDVIVELERQLYERKTPESKTHPSGSSWYGEYMTDEMTQVWNMVSKNED